MGKSAGKRRRTYWDKLDPEVREIIREKAREGLSPEAISERLAERGVPIPAYSITFFIHKRCSDVLPERKVKTDEKKRRLSAERARNKKLLTHKTCEACGVEFGPTVVSRKACFACCPQSVDLTRFRAYGVTFPEYQEILKDQNFRCAVCEDPLDLNDRKKVSIDHCHKTWRVRGICCQRCNSLLSGIDDPSWLTKAVGYIYLHPPVGTRYTSDAPPKLRLQRIETEP